MRILSVASEIYPLIKTGGLADVAGALPIALERLGATVHSVVPGYPKLIEAIGDAESIHAYENLFGGPARILAAKASGLALLIIDAPHLFGRPGNPYLDESGRDWPDNAQRFAALSQVAAQLGHGLIPSLRPDIVHAHDWQAGLTPAFLLYGGEPRPATIMTVHNMAFQGTFPGYLLAGLGLPGRSWAFDGVEYHGAISFLKAGLQLADRITTVSPTYAMETATAEYGMGMEGLLQSRSDHYTGILNGIDTEVWNPDSDGLIAATYNTRSLGRRRRNKQALQLRFGLADRPDALLFGVISRLSWQKGMDLLLPELRTLERLDAQLVVLGSGDQPLQDGFRQAALRMPGRVGTFIGYDEALAHLVQSGADVLLVPSRFEPCGLTQLCALRYGALPLVSRVGGLNDTVIDANQAALSSGVATGFQFSPVAQDSLAQALARAATLWRDQDVWRRMQLNGMNFDVGWDRPAARYLQLYREAGARLK